MDVIFKGKHTVGEAAESILSILKMFKDKYGIVNFRNIKLQASLLDHEGKIIDLVDAETSETLTVFEVYKAEELPLEEKKHKHKHKHKHLRLVVDNTKPKD